MGCGGTDPANSEHCNPAFVLMVAFGRNRSDELRLKSFPFRRGDGLTSSNHLTESRF